MCTAEKKERILHYICEHLRQYGYPPTLRELRSAIDARSVSTVSTYVDELVREGRLKKGEGRRSRCLLPVDFEFLRELPEQQYSRVKIRTADGGCFYIDCGVRAGANETYECVFSGILDCSELKSPVSRVVDFDVV